MSVLVSEYHFFTNDITCDILNLDTKIILLGKSPTNKMVCLQDTLAIISSEGDCCGKW